MSVQNHTAVLLKLLYFALGLGAAYLLLRFALPWLLPFLLAFLTARLIRPLALWFQKRLHFPQGLASALSCVLALLLLAGLAWLVLGRILYELSDAAERLPELLSQMPSLFGGLEDRLYKWIIAAPLEAQEYLFAAAESILSQASRLPETLYSWVLSLLSALVSGAPGAVLSVVVYGISLFLISGSYSRITAFLMAQIPLRHRQGARTMQRSMFSSLGHWFRTQLILMGITFLELCLALGLLRVPYFVVTALGIAFIDALPILGAGIILGPWGIFLILTGNLGRGLLFLALWAVVALVRQALEPRLLGRQIGLHPVATLMAMYVGFRAAGVLGVILSPLLLITLKQVNDSGLVTLWKTEEMQHV